MITVISVNKLKKALKLINMPSALLLIMSLKESRLWLRCDK